MISTHGITDHGRVLKGTSPDTCANEGGIFHPDAPVALLLMNVVSIL